MFFFMLTSCKSPYIEINQTTKTIIQDDFHDFTFNIDTNLDDLILVKVDNNNNFEYTLTKEDSGYILNLVLYKPQSFKSVTFKHKEKEYICDIGNVKVIDFNIENQNAINLVVDDNEEVYIYNKLASAIIVKEIKVYGGDYFEHHDYNDLIQPKTLTSIGHIYQTEDIYVVYIKYQYQTKNYEEVFEVK